MKNITIILVIAFILVTGLGVFFISPEISYAQGGLVPCDGPECNMCHLALLAENVINFIIKVSFAVVALLFAYAGFLYFTGGSDPGRISNAKSIFTNAFIGIIIILTGWLVVNVLLTTLTGDGVGKITDVLKGVNCNTSSSQTSTQSNTLIKDTSPVKVNSSVQEYGPSF